ncbi:nucleoside deaminase [Bremerella sp. JC770]|uniref:nucleoside deaminase n=1 Tax=Bremerella sp. JC770 TaxID=3232137 RepID=UPI003457E0C5
MTPESLMQLAIEKCREGIAQGQTPFGCAIELNGEVIAVAHNSVWQTIDITAHAEINAIREACQQTGHPLLTGATVATTCEPCPMCAAALHWARVDKVYFGATIADAEAAGFRELDLPAETVIAAGGGSTILVPNLLRDSCRELFDVWKQDEHRRHY